MFVDEGVGEEDEDGGEGHEGGGDAGARVLDCHEGEGDAEDWSEEGHYQRISHADGVVDGPFELRQAFLDCHKDDEAGGADDGSDHGGGEGEHVGHEFGGVGGDGVGVVLHADFAEDESYALAQAGAEAQQDAFEGEGQVHLVVSVAAEDGYGYAAECYGHGEHGCPGEGFAEDDPAGDGGHGRGEGHE